LSPGRRYRASSPCTTSHQGFSRPPLGDLALPPGFFSIDRVEFYGGVSFLKAGLFYADRLTNVSQPMPEKFRRRLSATVSTGCCAAALTH
jgi:glycogen synthase